jgi:hypothetical protein
MENGLQEPVRKQVKEDGRKSNCNQTDKRTKETGTNNGPPAEPQG